MSNWITNKDDIIRQKLRLQISMWYSSWYMGDNIEKDRHLMLFDSYFDPIRFDKLDSDELREEEYKFLRELQDLVNKTSSGK